MAIQQTARRTGNSKLIFNKETKAIEIKKRRRIVVATNSLVSADYEAYTNHIQTWFKFGRSYPDLEFIMCNPARMSIDRMRNMAADVALESESDYLLFMDDDVLVQPDGLRKLLDCDADIAAAKVVIRGYPFDWMIFKNRGGTVQNPHLFSCPDLPDEGIDPCDAVGFSFCLIKTSVLKSVQKPYFVTGVNNTEDIYFCVKARQINPKLKIVCECSQLCGHILWPQVMDARNREAYKKFVEDTNPILQAELKQKAEMDRNPRGDRSKNYLKAVKEVTR